jgi:hypothetical protein
VVRSSVLNGVPRSSVCVLGLDLVRRLTCFLDREILGIKAAGARSE